MKNRICGTCRFPCFAVCSRGGSLRTAVREICAAARACPSRGEKHGDTARSCRVPARNAGARHDRTARADLRYFRRRHRRSAARPAGNNRGSSAGDNSEKYSSAGKNHSGENLSGNSSAGNDPAAGNGSADNGSARNGRSGNGSSRNGGPEQKHSTGFPGA